MLHACLLILAGLVALIVAADLLVRGAVWIALRLGISPMTVGLTLVAFGTSAPELMVSLDAAAKDMGTIALANVLGSNNANILLIVGAAALIRRIRIHVARLELLFLLLATALAGLPYVLGCHVERWLGVLMLLMLLAFCWALLHRERHRPAAHHPTPPRPPGGAGRWLLNVGLVLVGLLGLKYGADWLIDGSSAVARHFGMGEALIGMTVVAVGTSLPELATSVVAARKDQPEIAVGNILGSNIFNVGLVLGAASLIFPLPVVHAETGALMGATVVSAILLCVVLRAAGGVPRAMGGAFLLGWIGYVGWEVWRAGLL